MTSTLKQCYKNVTLAIVTEYVMQTTTKKEWQMQKEEQNCHDPKYNQDKFSHLIN